MSFPCKCALSSIILSCWHSISLEAVNILYSKYTKFFIDLKFQLIILVIMSVENLSFSLPPLPRLFFCPSVCLSVCLVCLSVCLSLSLSLSLFLSLSLSISFSLSYSLFAFFSVSLLHFLLILTFCPDSIFVPVRLRIHFR